MKQGRAGQYIPEIEETDRHLGAVVVVVVVGRRPSGKA